VAALAACPDDAVHGPAEQHHEHGQRQPHSDPSSIYSGSPTLSDGLALPNSAGACVQVHAPMAALRRCGRLCRSSSSTRTRMAMASIRVMFTRAGMSCLWANSPFPSDCPSLSTVLEQRIWKRVPHIQDAAGPTQAIQRPAHRSCCPNVVLDYAIAPPSGVGVFGGVSSTLWWRSRVWVSIPPGGAKKTLPLRPPQFQTRNCSRNRNRHCGIRPAAHPAPAHIRSTSCEHGFDVMYAHPSVLPDALDPIVVKVCSCP
jgi:hypothetical protein